MHAPRMCIGLVLLSSIPIARTQLQCPAGSTRSVEPGDGIWPTPIANISAEYLEFRYTSDTYGRGQSEYEVTFAETTICDVLIVGGGGSGGASIGGGGGAGGVVYIKDAKLRSGTHTVLVGRGGAEVDSTVTHYNSDHRSPKEEWCNFNRQKGSLNQGKDGKSSSIISSGSVVTVIRGTHDIRFEGKGGGGVSFDLSPLTV